MNRLILRWTLVILVALVAAFAGTFLIMNNAVERYIANEPPPFGEMIAETIEDQTVGMSEAEVAAGVDRWGQEHDLPVQLVQLDQLDLPEYAVEALERGEAAWVKPGPQPTVYTPFRDGAFVLQVGPFPGFFHPGPTELVLVVTAMVLISGAAAWLLLLPTVRRLRQLQHAAAAIGDGELATRVPVVHDDAIGQLEEHFNAMAERVAGLLAARQELVQAVAHEIRTPIARVRFAAEMAQMTDDPDERARRMAQAEEDLTELDSLVGELLTLTRYDEGTAELPKSDVPVAPAVADVVEREIAGQLDVDVDVPPDLTVWADPRSFRRVLRNLLSNARRYAGSQVRVRAWESEDAVYVEVSDDGPGVPDEDRERIFEAFGRADASRERGTGGVGLGLAIVERVLESHGGTVTLGEGPGARFVTRWPR